MPVALNHADAPSSSAFPTQQPTYREIAQLQSVTKPDQIKQPKLQPPATYQKKPVKTQTSMANQTEMQRCEISGPPSFGPYARGASTTGDYYSAASGQMPKDVKTASGNTEYHTAASSIFGTKRPALSYSNNQLRPLV